MMLAGRNLPSPDLGVSSPSLFLALGCSCDESLLSVQSVLFLKIRIAHVLPVSVHVAGFGLLFEVGTEDLVTDHANKALVLHGEVHLDSPIQVARHKIRAAEVHLFLSVIAE